MADPAENRLALLFESAVNLPAADRAAFLDAACGADAVLRAKLQRLIDAHEASGDFLPLNPKSTRVSPEPHPDALTTWNLVGTNIGSYRLLEQIGEGGWGMVFVAEQRVPVRRRVALKLIKPGMDSKALIARFESERQAVALMEHPNIAKFLDAGTTPLGHPYFVMELVRGTRITDFCDQARSSTRERLELFVDVCRAVQHAHQKGVIHRDIKPSNILVTSQDGKPVPKIIDFGIAKATQGILTEGTVYTQFHQFIGTPAYMSPEQAEMTSLDIDTRTDIYSLGVLLYELLTGQPPFDPQELMAAGLDAMRKTIREKNPPRPSTRLSTLLNAELTLLAHRRNAEPPRLVDLVRGDLDWIAMRCLEKERSRRYETANDLAADIRRHLDNQPVLARPPSVAYWMQKAWRRHKSTLSTVVLFALTLLAAAAISVRSALRANRLAKTEAIQRQRVEQALIWMEVEKSDALFAADDSSAALAYLVRASRRDPFNEAAAARVLSALTQRSFNPSLTEPLRHQAEVVYAQFSPDGERVVTASEDGSARVWEVPTIPLPVPKWVPQLAEAIADQRFDERGLPHAVSFAEFQSLKESLYKSSVVDVWTRWAKWLFANPAARTLSPLATTTLPEYVNRRIQENTLDSLQEAVRLAPENGLGWARLGRAVFSQPEGENPRQAGEVAWCSLQAIRFAPDEAETWELKGDIFARSGRESEALEAYDRGIATALAKRSESSSARRQALAKSVGLLRSLGRLTTAAVEIRSTLGIPERDSKAGPDLLDLSPFYNAPLSGNWDSTFPSNDLSELPTGIQTMAGVRFDVRGLVQLAGGGLKPGSFPDRIGGIPVRAKATRLRFLQGVTCAQARFLGQPFGKYVFHYANGTVLERPLVLGRDALDWWDAPPPLTEEGLVVAWSGGNPARSPSGGTVQLYLVTWNNPRPEAWIESVDFISSGEGGGPFLVAATVE